MESSDPQTLEEALASTEADALAVLQAAGALMAPLRRFRAAVRAGDLRELQASLSVTENAMTKLRQQLAEARKGWSFDVQRYLSSGLYAKEVMATAQQAGVNIFERDDRLYCYPALLRIAPNEKAIVVDGKWECRIHPTMLVNLLKELQERPPRFRSESFLAALFEVYSKIVAQNGDGPLSLAPVVPLMDIYRLLTLLPGQAREYSRQEFARDIYLLHRGGVDTTRSGARVSFPISRGVRGKILTVIDENGEQKRYYGIRFTQGH
jgi:hypothetical protein